MSLPGAYCHAEAFIGDDGQIDWMATGCSASSSR